MPVCDLKKSPNYQFPLNNGTPPPLLKSPFLMPQSRTSSLVSPLRPHFPLYLSSSLADTLIRVPSLSLSLSIYLILRSFMASFWSFTSILLALMVPHCSSSLASPPSVRISTISAAPTVLPAAPLASPPLSPDIEPLFPSPGKGAFSPSDSSLPTIPASPSPPNPDAFGVPGPVMAFPPSESMPAHAPASHSSSHPLNLISCLASLVICFMLQLHGM